MQLLLLDEIQYVATTCWFDEAHAEFVLHKYYLWERTCAAPMLECRFESRLGLEFSGFSMWHFLKLVVRGFLRVLRFPPFFTG